MKLAPQFRRFVRSSGVPRQMREAQLALLRLISKLERKQRTPTDPAGRMRVLIHTPTYLPLVAAGSEVTMHETVLELARRGHDVRVLVNGTGYPSTLDGVAILENRNRAVARDAYRWSTVVLVQLNARNEAMRLAARYRRPIAHFLRMGTVDENKVPGRPDLVVFNATWSSDRSTWAGRSCVLHPRVIGDVYRTTPGTAIGMANLSEYKGADVFYSLARRFPARQFVGVRGDRATQVVPSPLPANVEILDHGTDMRRFYSRVRVLLMPSKFEAFGRVGLEAACSGIPTIAHPSAGVLECLGPTALYADRADVDAWVAHIISLDEPSTYRERAAQARARAESWDFGQEFDHFEVELRAVSLGGEEVVTGLSGPG